MDFADLTKSEREKTAEILGTWRTHPDWKPSHPNRSLRLLKRSLTPGFGLLVMALLLIVLVAAVRRGV